MRCVSLNINEANAGTQVIHAGQQRPPRRFQGLILEPRDQHRATDHRHSSAARFFAQIAQVLQDRHGVLVILDQCDAGLVAVLTHFD